MPVSIPLSFFYRKLPLKQELLGVLLPHDYSQADEWVPQKRYPIEIKPCSSEGFFLTEIEMFRQQFLKVLVEASVFDRYRWRFVRARVVTDDGKVFSVNFTPSIRKEFQKLRSEAQSSGKSNAGD